MSGPLGPGFAAELKFLPPGAVCPLWKLVIQQPLLRNELTVKKSVLHEMLEGAFWVLQTQQRQ